MVRHNMISRPASANRARTAWRNAASLSALVLALAVSAHPAAAANLIAVDDASLRKAISQAVAGDTIVFGGNITLQSALPNLTHDVTIDGRNFTLSGNGKYRGLFVQSGNIFIVGLTITSTVAQGGKGGDGQGEGRGAPGGGGGGGGAGLGGAFYVASGAGVAINNVIFQNNAARGGSGAGAAANNKLRTSGGGGGTLGDGGNGGTFQDGDPGAGGGGKGGGGAGGFGGGGGGAQSTPAGAGGFGGGGGGAGLGASNAGVGGFGGGMGSVYATTGTAGGGGGAGLGGAIFVEQGGRLGIAGEALINGNSAVGGSGVANRSGNGQGFGNGIFLQGNGSFSVDVAQSRTQTIADPIADQTGSGGTGANAGSWSLVKTGGGTLRLSGANTYSGGTTVTTGVLTGTGVQGNIANSGLVLFQDAGNYSVSISGQGDVQVKGALVTLTGASTYDGRTIIDGGQLIVATNASLSPNSLVILANGGVIGNPDRTGLVEPIANDFALVGSGVFRSGAQTSERITGAIGGAGTLIKDGAGTLELSGINTYTGGTRVIAGLLQFASDASLGNGGVITLTGAGLVGSTDAVPAATAINRSIVLEGDGGIFVALHPLTWSGAISGPGAFIKDGPGELELTGANTYTGGTNVQRGTLRIASDAELGQAGTPITLNGGGLRASASLTLDRREVNITGLGGSLLVDAGQALTINGALTGGSPTGGSPLTKVGAGTLVLTGANTFTGTVYNNGGVIQGNSASLNNFTVRFDRNTGNTTPRSVVFDQGTTGSYTATIVGLGSVTKIGAGKLSIPGEQLYTGTTDINAGELNVNGSLASSSMVNVNPGGTLSGNGEFGNVTNNGGKVSPGNSIGTLHIHGNFNMGPNSQYYAEINGVTSDQIIVGGTANIQSSLFEIAHDTNSAAPPVLPGITYTLITTRGGLTVSAPAIGIADFPFIAFKLSTDGFNGYLTTSRSTESFASLAATPNQAAVAAGLDGAGPGNPVFVQVVGATEAQARAAFASLADVSIHANAAAVLSEDSRFLRDAVFTRLGGLAAQDTALAQDNPAQTTGLGGAGSDKTVALWAQGGGNWGALGGNGNAARTSHSEDGIVSGIDITGEGRWRLGLAGGYSRSQFDSPAIAASGSADNYHLALYGGAQFGALAVRGGAGLSWDHVSTSRQTTAVNLSEVQSGRDELKTSQMFGELGYGYRLGKSEIEPFANLTYVRIDGNVHETGSASVAGDARLATTFSIAGVHGAAALSKALSLRGTLAWRHAFGDIDPSAGLTFQSGSAPFTVLGSPLARDTAELQAVLNAKIGTRTTIGVSWGGSYSQNTHVDSVSGDLVWRF